MSRQLLVSQGLFIIVAPQSYSGAPHSIVFLWTSNQPVTEMPLPDNTTSQETSMPPAGFGPTIPSSEWPQKDALDGAATGVG